MVSFNQLKKRKFMEFSKYTPHQTEQIHQLFIETFTDSEGPEEGKIIGRLVQDLMASPDKENIIGFIATESGVIIAGIFFTRLTFESDVNAFILAPVAVHTDHQGKGVGQALIHYGLDCLKQDGVELAFTYGDINFYSKVGFEHIDESIARAPLTLSYPKGWLAQSLISDHIEPIPGNTRCVPEFNKPEYW